MGTDGDGSGGEAGNALKSSTIDLRASLSSRPESGAHVWGATRAEKNKVGAPPSSLMSKKRKSGTAGDGNGGKLSAARQSKDLRASLSSRSKRDSGAVVAGGGENSEVRAGPASLMSKKRKVEHAAAQGSAPVVAAQAVFPAALMSKRRRDHLDSAARERAPACSTVVAAEAVGLAAEKPAGAAVAAALPEPNSPSPALSRAGGGLTRESLARDRARERDLETWTLDTAERDLERERDRRLDTASQDCISRSRDRHNSSHHLPSKGDDREGDVEGARRHCRSRSRDGHTRDNDREGAAIAGSIADSASGLSACTSTVPRDGSHIQRRCHGPDCRSGRGQDRRDHDLNTCDERRNNAGRRRWRCRSRDRERHHHGVARSLRHEPAHAGRGGSRGGGRQGAARDGTELNRQITKSGATGELCSLPSFVPGVFLCASQ